MPVRNIRFRFSYERDEPLPLARWTTTLPAIHGYGLIVTGLLLAFWQVLVGLLFIVVGLSAVLYARRRNGPGTR